MQGSHGLCKESHGTCKKVMVMQGEVMELDISRNKEIHGLDRHAKCSEA